MRQTFIFGILAVNLIAISGSAMAAPTGTDPVAATNAAFEQRLKCAAYYRLTVDVAERRRPTARRAQLIRTYAAVGQNMLIQASALANRAGADAASLRTTFADNLKLLRGQALGKPQVYNAIAARMHGVCQRLIVQ